MDSTVKALRSFSGMVSPQADMLMYPQSVNNPDYEHYGYDDYYNYNSTNPSNDYIFLGNNKYLEKDDDDATYIGTLDPQTPEDGPQRVIVSGPMPLTLPYAVNGNKVSLNNRAFQYHGHNTRTVIPVGNDAKWENIKHRTVKSGPMSTTVPAYARPQATQTPKPVKKAEPVKTATLNLNPTVPSWVAKDDEINRRYANMQPVENTAPVVNTPKPVQKNTRPVYMPMSTDQAIELRRRQYGKSYF